MNRECELIQKINEWTQVCIGIQSFMKKIGVRGTQKGEKLLL